MDDDAMRMVGDRRPRADVRVRFDVADGRRHRLTEHGRRLVVALEPLSQWAIDWAKGNPQALPPDDANA